MIGPNGSGKTTLFNMLTGLVRPDGGTILLAATDITRLPPHEIAERGITRTFQNLRLFNNLTRDGKRAGRHSMRARSRHARRRLAHARRAARGSRRVALGASRSSACSAIA